MDYTNRLPFVRETKRTFVYDTERGVSTPVSRVYLPKADYPDGPPEAVVVTVVPVTGERPSD